MIPLTFNALFSLGIVAIVVATMALLKGQRITCVAWFVVCVGAFALAGVAQTYDERHLDARAERAALEQR